MLNSLFKNKKNIIPFKNDLLFHFFNKKTQISDTYLLDPISNLKLYPKKSKAVKPTALSTGISLPNSEIDLIGKVEVFLHHKLADFENFGFVWASQNTLPSYATTGLYLTSGKNGYSTLFKGSLAANCIILTSALEDDNYYIMTSDFMTDNITMKANKVTIVNNAIVIGNDINGTTTAKGTETLTADIGVLSGRNNTAYFHSSKHKVIWVKFYDKQGALMHEFNFSEGAGEQVFDIVSGNAYDISNITPADFWNYTQDFNHYNFRYGFTLYQKAGADDIRIPNKKDQSEITPTSIPSGYSRIANYKECRQTFNQCENVFVLDDVAVGTQVIDFTFKSGHLAVFLANEIFVQTTTQNGRPKYVAQSSASKYIYWSGTAWIIWGNATIQAQNSSNVATFDLVVYSNWNGYFQTAGSSFTSSFIGTSDLYDADPDFVLFTESTGVAKEIEIQDIYSDVVDLTLDRGHLYINSDSNKNMMLYKSDKGVDTPEDLKIWAYVEK